MYVACHLLHKEMDSVCPWSKIPVSFRQENKKNQMRIFITLNPIVNYYTVFFSSSYSKENFTLSFSSGLYVNALSFSTSVFRDNVLHWAMQKKEIHMNFCAQCDGKLEDGRRIIIIFLHFDFLRCLSLK